MESQHRERELENDQCHRHRPELAVERHVIIPEFRKRHEIPAHPEEYGYKGRCEEPPFVPSLAQEQSEEEEEDCYRTHVHRPCSERLRSPIKRQGLRNGIGIGLAVLLQQADGMGLGWIDGARGGATVEIGNHHVRQFLPSVGPGSGVVEVEAFGLFLSVILIAGCEFRTSAHRVLGIQVGGYQLVGIGSNSSKPEEEQEE